MTTSITPDRAHLIAQADRFLSWVREQREVRTFNLSLHSGQVLAMFDELAGAEVLADLIPWDAERPAYRPSYVPKSDIVSTASSFAFAGVFVSLYSWKPERRPDLAVGLVDVDSAVTLQVAGGVL